MPKPIADLGLGQALVGQIASRPAGRTATGPQREHQTEQHLGLLGLVLRRGSRDDPQVVGPVLGLVHGLARRQEGRAACFPQVLRRRLLDPSDADADVPPTLPHERQRGLHH